MTAIVFSIMFSMTVIVFSMTAIVLSMTVIMFSMTEKVLSMDSVQNDYIYSYQNKSATLKGFILIKCYKNAG